MRFSRRNKVPKEGNTRQGRVCVSQGETEPSRRTILAQEGYAFLKEDQCPPGGQYPPRAGSRFSRRNKVLKEDNTRLGGVCASQGETKSPRRTILA